MNAKGEAAAKLDAYGVDQVCEDIANKTHLDTIAKRLGVSLESFLRWIEKDPNRSARVREVRTWMAKVWEEEAERVLQEAGNDIHGEGTAAIEARKFALAKAKELAHHYRWRAKAIAPKEFGDGVTVRGDKDNPIRTEGGRFDLSREELLAIAGAGRAEGA